MDKTVHHTLCKLKVLSKIEPGQNLMVSESNFKIVDCHNNWERFLKWWLGENRYKTTTKLEKFTVELRDLINNLLSNVKDNKKHLTRLQAEMLSAVSGLECLKNTYGDDKTVISQLEILQENFQIELDRLNEKFGNENNLHKVQLNNEFMNNNMDSDLMDDLLTNMRTNINLNNPFL